MAHIIDNAEMAIAPRNMVLADLWTDGSTNAFEALLLGESINDKSIIGTAYYQILVSESPRWVEDARLNERHRRHLECGNNQCIAESLADLDHWGQLAAELQPDSTLSASRDQAYGESSYKYRWLHLVLVEIDGD